MTHSSIPENWQELMAGYALGDLSSEEAESLQRLLSENSELASEVDQFQEVLALMPYGLPDEPEPPSRLRDAILSQAEADTNGIVQLDRSPRSGRKITGSWSQLGGAIAALFLITLAIDNYQLRQTTKQNQIAIGRLQQTAQTNEALITALRQPNAKVYALDGTATSGSLVFVPAQNRVTLVTDLPQLPTGKIYRLWVMPENASKPTYCGEFEAEAIASWALPEKVCRQNGDRMLITTELAADPPIPKGELVMKSKS
jgi:anti-sigma-K factor RskA